MRRFGKSLADVASFNVTRAGIGSFLKSYTIRTSALHHNHVELLMLIEPKVACT